MNNPPTGTGDGPRSNMGDASETETGPAGATAGPDPAEAGFQGDGRISSWPPPTAQYQETPPSRMLLAWRSFIGFPITKIVVFFVIFLILMIPLGIPIVFRFLFNKPLLLF